MTYTVGAMNAAYKHQCEVGLIQVRGSMRLRRNKRRLGMMELLRAERDYYLTKLREK